MPDRYIPNGTPLTPWETEILTVLMEEAAEVIQAASKLIRFGKENRPGPDAVPNTMVLGLEVGDLEEMLSLANYVGLVSTEDINAGMIRKRARFRKYSQHMPAEILSA